MNCCQGIEEVFSQPYVAKELSRYRAKGPSQTTRMLTGAIEKEGVAGLSLLDIGGGVGAIQQTLLDAGLTQATDVDASAAFIDAAQSEARRRGTLGRVTYRHGNFINLATELGPADIVTLDRVICCYPEMEKMVSLSAGRARKLYGLVYPRDTWWVKAGIAIMNLFLRLRGSAYRSYVHPSAAVEAIIARTGLKQLSHRQTWIWQVAVYAR